MYVWDAPNLLVDCASELTTLLGCSFNPAHYIVLWVIIVFMARWVVDETDFMELCWSNSATIPYGLGDLMIWIVWGLKLKCIEQVVAEVCIWGLNFHFLPI